MVRFGICGCGGFVENGVLPLLQRIENLQVVAVYNPSPTRLERVAEKFGIKHRFQNYEDLVACKEVDAIYIASPNVYHKDQTIAAANAGKNVLCEKPMGMNAEECRQMIEVCRAKGVKLGVGFCYPFAGAQQKVRELLRDGAIGEVSYYTISYSLGGYNKDTVGWRCDPKMSGGGPLMDIAPHMINLGCFFLDDTVASVMSYVRPELTSEEIELDAIALMEFSRGARGMIDTSFVRSNTHNYSLIGTKGEIHAVNTMCWRAGGKLVLQTYGKEQEIPFEPIEGIEEEFRQFAHAVDKNENLGMPGQTGRHTQAVIDAIYESGRTGIRTRVVS
jgi:predicted dehydrogenase